MPHPANQKTELRRAALGARRAVMNPEALSRRIWARLEGLAEFAAARTLLVYLDVRNEVRTRFRLAELLASDRRIVVPYCDGKRLRLVQLRDPAELEPGAFGVLEPTAELRARAERRVEPAEVDLVIVPGVAFDRRGGRLGHGQGYYDRLLAELRPDAARIGLAFACQIVASVPLETHDVRVDAVVTEDAVYATGLEPLDLPRLESLHGTSNWPVDRIDHRPEVSSTNDVARQRAADLPREARLLCLAEEQTAGRGRGANRWWTGPGALAWSLLLDPTARRIDPRDACLVPLAAALAIIDAVGAVAGRGGLGVHWPNDVFAGLRKLAGILVEMLPDGRQIVGVGINVNSRALAAPAELAPRVATVRDLVGLPVDRTALLVDVLRQFDRALDLLAAAREALAARADELCLQHGRTLTIDVGGQRTTGRCQGIAADGALVLDTPSGRRAFYSGVLIHADRAG